MGGRPRAAVQGGEHKGGDEGKEEEKRSMVSKSFEPREKWEEKDEDRWKEKETKERAKNAAEVAAKASKGAY